MRALVIDDSRAMRLILTRTLSDLGIEVSQAESGRVALQVLDHGFEPDLIMVDWNMPEMSGIEFVNKVRHTSDGEKVSILMVTTETGLPRVMEALAVGVDEYVMKPFTTEAIISKLQLVGVDVG